MRKNLGNCYTLSDGDALGNGYTLGEDCTLGTCVTLGSYNTITYNCTIGSNATIGNYNTFGRHCTFGNWSRLGYDNKIGDQCTLGDDCVLGEGNALGYGFSFGKRLMMAGCRVLALMCMSNVDGSGRNITIIVHTVGIKIEAGCFSDTLDAFCEKAMSEGKTRYARVVRAAAEALQADVVEKGITGGWDEEDKMNKTTEKLIQDLEEARASSNEIQEAFSEMLSVLKDLQESAAYWSEYDVPLGIVDRINEAIEKAEFVAS